MKKRRKFERERGMENRRELEREREMNRRQIGT